MTNPDDQHGPATGKPDEGGQPQTRRPNGNAPSWVDDVLGSSGAQTPSTRPDLSKPNLSQPDLTKPDLNKTPPLGDLRIPETARPTPAPAAATEDWISRVTGSPPPASSTAATASPTPRPTAPDLDAWGEPQRPTLQPSAHADERPRLPTVLDDTPAGDVAQKRLIAGLLAIFLGSLGVHKFYLGLNTPGILILGVNVGVWVLALLIGLVTFGIGLVITLPLAGLVSSALGLLGLVEGILYLTKSDADFQREYLVGKKPWL